MSLARLLMPLGHAAHHSARAVAGRTTAPFYGFARCFSTEASENIIAVTSENMNEVMNMSKEVPIILDCYADWCGPCKQLKPLLERAVEEENGSFKLATLDVDHNQEIAGQLKVSSIPAVFVIHGGSMYEGFTGLPSEEAVFDFVSKVVMLPTTHPMKDE